MRKSMMVIGAHPDDEVLGVGGTMAHYAQKGWKINTLIFTKGEVSPAWIKKEIVHRDRMREVAKATALVGSHEPVFLDLRDTKMMQDIKNPKVLADVKSFIWKHKPSRIFTHTFDDRLFSDHRAVHITVLKAVRELRAEHPKYNPEVWGFNIWTMNVRERQRPQLVVDVSKTFHKKLQALYCFKSQSVVLWQLVPFVYAKAIIAGLNYDTKYVELFHQLHPL